MTLTEISFATRLPDSTTYRLLRTLECEGMIERADDGSGRYQLGLELFRLGSSVRERLGLGVQIVPDLEQLAAKTGETVNLGVLHGFHVLYLQKVESQQPLRASLTVGSATVPAYCSSTGKVMLAALSQEELDELLSTHELDTLGPNTIVNKEELRRELELVRKRGYAIDNLEFASDIRSVAAPIHDYRGVVIAALAIAGPSTRLSQERTQDLSPEVIAMAQHISRNIGYSK